MSVLAGFILPHPPLILPEIGKGQENIISKTVSSYKTVMAEVKRLNPDTIVIISPHALCYYDYFHISPGEKAEGDFSQFGAGQVKIQARYDEEMTSLLNYACQRNEVRAGTMGDKRPELDHGTMIPLYFLKPYISDPRIIRVGLSGQPAIENYKLGTLIRKAAEDLSRNIVVLASGDLSHVLKADGPYGYKKEGPEFDKKITKMMEEGDFLSFFSFDSSFLEKAEECGLGSFQIMAGILDGDKVDSKLLSYEGPFGVGYGVASFIVSGKDKSHELLPILQNRTDEIVKKRKEKEDAYVQLARKTVETYVKTGKVIDLPSDVPDEFISTKAGAFVSLHIGDRLRGCIGTYAPYYPDLGEEIIHNAIAACSSDPRFPPVEANELNEITYSVDVLSGLIRVMDIKELDVKKYGIVVQHGHKRGLLLPDLEGVDTIEEQIKIAKQKAQMDKDENCTIYKFTTTRHL